MTGLWMEKPQVQRQHLSANVSSINSASNNSVGAISDTSDDGSNDEMSSIVNVTT
jgi:hypothetical protein